MSAQHTPGPWFIGDWGHIRSVCGRICTVAPKEGAANVANARLIAAAPLQHAELIACKQFLEDMHTQTPEWTIAESQKRHEAVCAAIAEATGETP